MYGHGGERESSGSGAPAGHYCPFGVRSACPAGAFCPRDGTQFTDRLRARLLQRHGRQVRSGVPALRHLPGRAHPAGHLLRRATLVVGSGLAAPNMRVLARGIIVRASGDGRSAKERYHAKTLPLYARDLLFGGRGSASRVKKGDYAYAQPCFPGFTANQPRWTPRVLGSVLPASIVRRARVYQYPRPRASARRGIRTVSPREVPTGKICANTTAEACKPRPPGAASRTTTAAQCICSPGFYRSIERRRRRRGGRRPAAAAACPRRVPGARTGNSRSRRM